ncbi:ABC transporter substrate-binding protein [Aurantiacibacter rhizosphaerae]|uniref:Peptide ABC transporter substrate-binding protein n=1 Tax=Aurantiacibacter rhizosphaerae TaxID=2691582 RepID=A0A844XG30_9SPHN|nr:ABC transporter substrate-binding protein [Aurantiacibacter rhizosphaerae]MWV28780.1 peptide ABC transporter substrate-binding protein [Aurantiacibacter rhizosphaerae]
MIARRSIVLPAMCLALAACGSSDDGAIDVALIGSPEDVLTSSLRLNSSAQHVRAATQSGLVTLNPQGETVPALAERWIVTDDGRSFIFRLREGNWPDGTPMSAASARDALLEALAGLEGTSLGLDLEPIEEVRAMAGRVIELRLSKPEPYLLQMLAQPEMALRQPGGETGPMVLEREEDSLALALKPPLERGLPDDEEWQRDVREIRLHIAPARESIALFSSGEAEAVLGGTLGDLVLVETGPLSSGTLRLDTTLGLFGLQVRADDGLLSNTGVREGLAMAIDRQALMAPYNISGWIPTTRPVSPGLPGDPGLIRERWDGEDLDGLRAEAAARIAAWREQFDTGDRSQPATITIAMGSAPGWDMLYRDLARQLSTIGLRLVRAQDASTADLVLVDRVARYPAPRWFLNQFNCSLDRGLCEEDVDALVEQALEETDPALRARTLAQAEAELTLANVYIPFGAPLRWSLVRGTVEAFMPNPYAFHPLPELAQIPR